MGALSDSIILRVTLLGKYCQKFLIKDKDWLLDGIKLYSSITDLKVNMHIALFWQINLGRSFGYLAFFLFLCEMLEEYILIVKSYISI